MKLFTDKFSPSIVEVLKQEFRPNEIDPRVATAYAHLFISPALILIHGDEVYIQGKVYRNTDPDTVGTDIIRSRLCAVYDHLVYSKPYKISGPNGTVVTIDRLTRNIERYMRDLEDFRPENVFRHFELVTKSHNECLNWIRATVLCVGADIGLLENYVTSSELPRWARHPGLIFYTRYSLYYCGFMYRHTVTTVKMLGLHDIATMTQDELRVKLYPELQNNEVFDLGNVLMGTGALACEDWYLHTGWGVVHDYMLNHPELFANPNNKP